MHAQIRTVPELPINPGPLSGHDTNNFGLPEYYDIPDFLVERDV